MQPAALRAVCLFRAKHQQEESEKDKNKRPRRVQGVSVGFFGGITIALQHISIDPDGRMLAGHMGRFFRVVHFLAENGQKKSFYT